MACIFTMLFLFHSIIYLIIYMSTYLRTGEYDECLRWQSTMKESGKVSIENYNNEYNMVAHLLAKFGRCNPPALWLDKSPISITKLLAQDVSVT